MSFENPEANRISGPPNYSDKKRSLGGRAIGQSGHHQNISIQELTNPSIVSKFLQMVRGKVFQNPYQSEPVQNPERQTTYHPLTAAAINKAPYEQFPDTKEFAFVVPNGDCAVAMASELEDGSTENAQSIQVMVKTISVAMQSLYRTGSLTPEIVTRMFEQIGRQGSSEITNRFCRISLAMAQPVEDKVYYSRIGNGSLYRVTNDGYMYPIIFNPGIRVVPSLDTMTVEEMNLDPRDRFLITTVNQLNEDFHQMEAVARGRLLYQLSRSKTPGAPSFDKTQLPNTTMSVIDLQS